VSDAAARFDAAPLIAKELSLQPANVAAVLSLLDEGGTVPFIARYRKEAHGSMDEVQIRAIQERAAYLDELEKRRRTVLDEIQNQGKLTDELRARIEACATKAELEDLYLPYKPKRRTRGTIARERGLEPLARRIRNQPRDGDPQTEARAFVDEEKGVPDTESALAGARDIVAEALAEDADNRAMVRRRLAREGRLVSKVIKKKMAEGRKFEQYYDHTEVLSRVPSHRYLAVARGENEKVLRVKVNLPDEALLPRLETRAGLTAASPFAAQLREAVADAYRRLILPSVATEARGGAREKAEIGAVDVFAQNLENLLLAAPLGGAPVVGIDPGLRTGCKCAAVDVTGRYLETITVYINRGPDGQSRAAQQLGAFLLRHRPRAVAVGNGTGGRDAEALTRRVIKEEPGLASTIAVQVSEAGASVYSASDIAREEFPDLDLTIRGAISIARRLQDPLAELVKIEPKAIGVGQYQHDVQQKLLARKLDEVVESCVNRVGVELNTASAPLLARVAGIGPRLGKNIVAHREASGAFATRRQLLKVKGLGPKAYEQAAGFLRLRGGKNPLDASAVHPERYKLVERMAADLGVKLPALVGDTALAGRVDLARYVAGDVGLPTLRDIVQELGKPGRDPRDDFQAPAFRDDVQEMSDLEEGMSLEGVVTNVTNFGAFVDVGVHQDGLVHISQLADHFVKDPHQVVKVGDRIKVRVLGVDLERKRISLSAKSGKKAPPPRGRSGGGGGGGMHKPSRKFSNNPFSKLGKG